MCYLLLKGEQFYSSTQSTWILKTEITQSNNYYIWKFVFGCIRKFEDCPEILRKISRVMIFKDIATFQTRYLKLIIISGLYDGNVCVYNAQLSLESSYQYKSDSVRDKHSNIVWEVSVSDL